MPMILNDIAALEINPTLFSTQKIYENIARHVIVVICIICGLNVVL